MTKGLIIIYHLSALMGCALDMDLYMRKMSVFFSEILWVGVGHLSQDPCALRSEKTPLWVPGLSPNPGSSLRAHQA